MLVLVVVVVVAVVAADRISTDAHAKASTGKD